ncbi:Replication factor C subunit 3 [Morella rubra]|uniref:Replication factor C subunit 3 n=1 Tax=Morella rubra TaxID=262757 RepID=A0A6A1WDE6_9ROSI|nr:Replication factor C subunit 3 [Morella rubra]
MFPLTFTYSTDRLPYNSSGSNEGLQLPSGFAARIAEKSNRSLRRAILSFETCRVQQYPFTSKQVIPPMDWEEYVAEIASDIMKEQSPKRIPLFPQRETSDYMKRTGPMVRGKLYELLVNCIPPEIILKRLVYELLKKLDAELKHEVCHWASYYEHRMRLGQKAIFHIEVDQLPNGVFYFWGFAAFVAKFMSIYKSFLIATFG